jgi:hypothetical protein
VAAEIVVAAVPDVGGAIARYGASGEFSGLLLKQQTLLLASSNNSGNL